MFFYYVRLLKRTGVIYTFSNSLNPIRSANYESQMAVNSAYGFVDLGYKTYAYLSLTGRFDKSSALLSPNNGFFYPSISLSILPTEFLNLGPISYLKLRSSYANVGSSFTSDNIGPSANFLGYGSDYRTPYGGPNYLQPTYNIINPLYNNQSGASFTRTLIDPNLKPSFSSSYEIGADIKVLKNRLGLDFTYFNSFDGPGNTNGQKIPTRWQYPGSERVINSANWKASLQKQYGNATDDINSVMWLIK
ncbi:MAG: TonB-dependent receptor [Saprospiraceae bacterium]|nr:TonB-dependent receptor [Saprospiraceae bacterium]